MKKTFLLLALFGLGQLHASAQIDYIEFKERYSLSCGIADSVDVVRNQHLIDSLSTLTMSNGEKTFLYDAGWTYYMRYLKWKDLDDLAVASEYFKRGWDEYADIHALWNLGTCQRPAGNCDKAIEYTEKYIAAAKDSLDIDYQQIYLRYKFCCGKE